MALKNKMKYNNISIADHASRSIVCHFILNCRKKETILLYRRSWSFISESETSFSADTTIAVCAVTLVPISSITDGNKPSPPILRNQGRRPEKSWWKIYFDRIPSKKRCKIDRHSKQSLFTENLLRYGPNLVSKSAV